MQYIQGTMRSTGYEEKNTYSEENSDNLEKKAIQDLKECLELENHFYFFQMELEFFIIT